MSDDPEITNSDGGDTGSSREPNEATEKTPKQAGLGADRNRIVAAAAMAIAGLGILPLTRVGSVEATTTVYCAYDYYNGQDVGDPADCNDCDQGMVPADCEFNCSSCGNCGGNCNNFDDPYGS